MDNRDMIDTFRTNHLPFAELPIEAMTLFYFESMSAWEYHCKRPHTSAEIYRDLEQIWNAEKLTQEDLRDWPRMSKLLETQLSQCLPQERSRIEPRLTTRGRPRQ
jgi:hypothetical protein